MSRRISGVFFESARFGFFHAVWISRGISGNCRRGERAGNPKGGSEELRSRTSASYGNCSEERHIRAGGVLVVRCGSLLLVQIPLSESRKTKHALSSTEQPCGRRVGGRCAGGVCSIGEANEKATRCGQVGCMFVKPSAWQPAGIDSLESAAVQGVRSSINTLVVAGPGAGKTEILAQRACFLLQTRLCAFPYRILAIS